MSGRCDSSYEWLNNGSGTGLILADMTHEGWDVTCTSGVALVPPGTIKRTPFALVCLPPAFGVPPRSASRHEGRVVEGAPRPSRA